MNTHKHEKKKNFDFFKHILLIKNNAYGILERGRTKRDSFWGFFLRLTS